MMIHKFTLNDLHIVLDINSGSVHVVDQTVMDLLDLFDEFGRFTTSVDFFSENERSAYAEIMSLIEQGLLFSSEITLDEVEKAVHRQPVVKALCLHIAHDCNLKCRYCFAQEGEYHQGRRSMMSSETGRQAIDFLIAASGSRRNLEVDFFGGEPLMNFQVVKDIVIYGRAQEKKHNKNFRFTITTNGLLLNEDNTAFINQHMQNVVLSLDGRPEVHDRMRPTPGGKGSFHLVLPKIQNLVQKRDKREYYVRGTYTRLNPDFSEDVLYLADLGFHALSIEPVVGDEKEDYTLLDEQIPGLLQEYEKLALQLLERKKINQEFHFFHFQIDLSGGPCTAKRVTGCGAGTEYLAVTPEGDLYPCHQFTGFDEFKMGSLRDGIIKPEISRQFENCHVYSKEDCRSCWARYYCSGGCAAAGWQMNGSIHAVNPLSCTLQKKRIECGIMMKAFEAMNRQPETSQV